MCCKIFVRKPTTSQFTCVEQGKVVLWNVPGGRLELRFIYLSALCVQGAEATDVEICQETDCMSYHPLRPGRCQREKKSIQEVIYTFVCLHLNADTSPTHENVRWGVMKVVTSDEQKREVASAFPQGSLRVGIMVLPH